MVYFSCDGCNEVLKKNQVDTHANRCRICHAVSCVDCNVSFPGDDYRSHTSCMTEAERYEKRTPAAKKGGGSSSGGKRTAQQQWQTLVEVCQEKAPAHLQPYLRTMAQLDNVPRKEKQFRNFTANSLNLRGIGKNGETIVSDIWNLLKTEREKQRELSLSSSSSTAGGSPRNAQPPSCDRPIGDSSTAGEASESAKTVVDEEPATKPTTPDSPPSAARKESSESETEKPSKDHSTKKAVKKVIKSLLKQTKDRTLTLKELRKAVQKQLLDVPRKDIKTLVLDATSEQKSFQSDGKVVKLSSKD